MRKVFVMAHDLARKLAMKAVAEAPDGYVITVAEPKRSLDQNAIFHALCEDIAKSDLTWAGQRRTPEQWKVLLVSGHSTATKFGSEMVPGLEGEFVNLRESTAAMSKARSSSLIEYTLAFCANNNVRVREHRRAA